MRELTEQETGLVFGGDGMQLPGGGYVSTTRVITNGLGVIGAGATAYNAGKLVGAGINYGYEAMTGSSLAHDAGGWMYRNS